MKYLKLLFLLGICSLSFAQEAEESVSTNPWDNGMGFHFGMNTSFSSNSVYPSENSYRLGYQFAVYGRFMFPVFVQPEFGWYQTFAEYQAGGESDKIVVNSMQLSLLAGYHFLDIEKLNVRLQSGPMMNFVVGSKWKNGNLGLVGPSDRSFFQSPSFNWRFGSGLNVGQFTFDLYFDLGITQVYNGNKTPGNTRNNSVALSFGYFFY